VVYGVLRTADAVSPHAASAVALTLGLFVVAYIFVFGAGAGYVLRLMRKGPQAFVHNNSPEGGPGEQKTPMRPLSAANVANDDDIGDGDGDGDAAANRTDTGNRPDRS
jgi:cytochrome d ubiquinol oxidase subunit I